MTDTSTETPQYATQGGGIATYRNGTYVWLEVPSDFPEMKVGDSIPEEWSTVPINEAARIEPDEDEFYYSADDPWWSDARSDW